MRLLLLGLCITLSLSSDSTKIEGDKLTVVTAPYPIGSGPQPNAMATSTLVFEREK
jgi:hypothetical protein